MDKTLKEQLSAIDGFEEIDFYFGDYLERRSVPSTELFLAGVAVSRAFREGHGCCLLAALPREEFPWPEPETWLAALRSPELGGVVTAYHDAQSTPVGQFAAPLVLDPAGRLYLHRCLADELTVASNIRKRLSRTAEFPPGTVSAVTGNFQAGSKLPETDFQQLAVFTALSRNFSVISGGPGTGKTTVVAALLALLLNADMQLEIALCAPTGKAQSRLNESIRSGLETLHVPESVRQKLRELEALTIPQLLGIAPGAERPRFHAGNRLPCQILIADESSMIPLALMAQLLEAAPEECRIILLGDKDQLASVEAGAVLADLCESAASNRLLPEAAVRFKAEHPQWNVMQADSRLLSGAVAELTRTYRFAGAPTLLAISREVRELRPEKLPALTESVVSAQEADFRTSHPKPAQFAAKLTELLTEPGESGLAFADLPRLARSGTPEAREQAFRLLDSFKVLCAVRQGPFGVVELNRIIRGILGFRGAWPPGSPVMILRNDNRTGLRNGDIGLVWPDAASGGVRIHFPGGKRGFLPVELPEHEDVFAMTVHKSQGSGFDRVLLLLPDDPANPILSRELFYTGITRARLRVDLWAEREVIASALRRKTLRQSGLSDRLAELG